MKNLYEWMRGMRSQDSRQPDEPARTSIASSLAENSRQLSILFDGFPDLTIRRLQSKSGLGVMLAYLDGLVDKKLINTDIIRPILYEKPTDPSDGLSSVPISPVKKIRDWSNIEQAILSGKSILFMDGESHAFELDTQGGPQRSIEEPNVESAIKSAHQGFVETMGQNIALVRRYIPSRKLKLKEMSIGERGHIKVSILYIEDVVNKQALHEIEKRIEQVNVDNILTIGELEEFIEDHSFTPFPQFVGTERPDTTASHLLQGRVAVLIDRSSTALVAPVTFISFFQVIDDYSVRWMVSSFVRLMRFAGLIIAVFLPSIYIAMISFHYEVIPLQLILSIGESREKVPFPPIVEALIMELVLEMLREAGLRLPSPLGQTIGIVGGIVIGQAAVQAGIVSNIMVIVVALTAISSFIIPNLELLGGIRLIRFPVMFIASIFGMVGIVISIMVIVVHLISLESLGVPYGSPLTPLYLSDMKDTFIRLPRWLMLNRPQSVGSQQPLRKGSIKKRG